MRAVALGRAVSTGPPSAGAFALQGPVPVPLYCIDDRHDFLVPFRRPCRACPPILRQHRRRRPRFAWLAVPRAPYELRPGRSPRRPQPSPRSAGRCRFLRAQSGSVPAPLDGPAAGPSGGRSKRLRGLVKYAATSLWIPRASRPRGGSGPAGCVLPGELAAGAASDSRRPDGGAWRRLVSERVRARRRRQLGSLRRLFEAPGGCVVNRGGWVGRKSLPPAEAAQIGGRSFDWCRQPAGRSSDRASGRASRLARCRSQRPSPWATILQAVRERHRGQIPVDVLSPSGR